MIVNFDVDFGRKVKRTNLAEKKKYNGRFP
jgi:hypothetical protein